MTYETQKYLDYRGLTIMQPIDLYGLSKNRRVMEMTERVRQSFDGCDVPKFWHTPTGKMEKTGAPHRKNGKKPEFLGWPTGKMEKTRHAHRKNGKKPGTPTGNLMTN